MCVKNGETLMFIPDCFKNKKMYNKATNNYAHILEFVYDCNKTQKLCNNVVDIYPFAN